MHISLSWTLNSNLVPNIYILSKFLYTFGSMYVNENENYVTYPKYHCQSTKQLIKKELLCTLVFQLRKVLWTTTTEKNTNKLKWKLYGIKSMLNRYFYETPYSIIYLFTRIHTAYVLLKNPIQHILF